MQREQIIWQLGRSLAWSLLCSSSCYDTFPAWPKKCKSRYCLSPYGSPQRVFFFLHSSKGRCGWKCLLKDQLKQFWFTRADNVVKGSTFANPRGVLNPREVFWRAGAGEILQSKPLGTEGKIRRDQWVEAVWFCFLARRIPEGILFPSLPPPFFFFSLFAHQGLSFWCLTFPWCNLVNPAQMFGKAA